MHMRGQPTCWLVARGFEWWCHSQLNGLSRDRQLPSAKSSQLSAAAKLVQLAQLAAGSGGRGHTQQPSVAWGGALGGCSHRGGGDGGAAAAGGAMGCCTSAPG